MEISINTHNVELTQRLQNHIERKTARLDRYMPNLAEVRVDLSSQKTRNAVERQVAQVTVRDDRGTFLRAEERSSDMFAAIDAVIDKLYRQIKRYRGKRIDSRRSGAGYDQDWLGEPLPPDVEAELEEEGEPAIVRHKQVPLRPMSPEEAIDQMELLGHNFFIYFDADEETIHVVYRRHDGDYGVLQPVFD